jgi:hypothetical protein
MRTTHLTEMAVAPSRGGTSFVGFLYNWIKCPWLKYLPQISSSYKASFGRVRFCFGKDRDCPPFLLKGYSLVRTL